VINHKETNLKERNQLITQQTGLSQLQILIIIAKEYELLNMIPKAKQTFSKLLENNPHDYETWVRKLSLEQLRQFSAAQQLPKDGCELAAAESAD
jgi:hypothetical protein